MHVKTQSAMQTNRYVLENYFRSDKKPAIVYVGSSLLNQLDFSEESPCVYSLAMSGGSALTGLNAIFLDTSTKPRLVFVEINVPQRGSDNALIAKASAMLPRISSLFLTENMPMNRALTYLYQFKREKLGSETNDVIRQLGLALQTREYAIPLAPEVIENSMAEFRQLKIKLERQGTELVFLEMPVHPELENLPQATQIRAAFRKTFPDNKFITYEELAKSSKIETIDGVHLTIEEGNIVISNLKPHHNEACSKQSG